MEADGTLTLRFTHAEVRVPPDPDFEAWNFGERRGVLVICMPGGDIAIFGPPETAGNAAGGAE